MSAIRAFGMRSPENRRGWLEGWLSAYECFATECASERDPMKVAEVLALSFRRQLAELVKEKGNG